MWYNADFLLFSCSDGNLRCNSTVRGSSALSELESMELQCVIGYRGNWAPVMEWRFSGKDGQVVSEGVQTISSQLLVTSVFSFTVYHTMNNRSVSCKTYFSSYTGNVTTTATNTPDYSYTWTSPSLNITCKLFCCGLRLMFVLHIALEIYCDHIQVNVY